jgi:Uma2 family endonuclease
VGRVAERSKVAAAEYLAWERQQPRKHEFFDGEVFALAGGSPRHNALCARIGGLLDAGLAPRGCHAMSSDQRVGIHGGDRYVYPDTTVVCGEIVLESNDVLVNPTIVVEVLSSETEQYDRGLKWDSYQRIESLTDYVLVSQREPRIEQFRRDRGGAWIYRAAGPGERIALSSGVELAVDTVFAGLMALPGD